jgi:hypothetical protein
MVLKLLLVTSDIFSVEFVLTDSCQVRYPTNKLGAIHYKKPGIQQQLPWLLHH